MLRTIFFQLLYQKYFRANVELLWVSKFSSPLNSRLVCCILLKHYIKIYECKKHNQNTALVQLKMLFSQFSVTITPSLWSFSLAKYWFGLALGFVFLAEYPLLKWTYWRHSHTSSQIQENLMSIFSQEKVLWVITWPFLFNFTAVEAQKRVNI